MRVKDRCKSLLCCRGKTAPELLENDETASAQRLANQRLAGVKPSTLTPVHQHDTAESICGNVAVAEALQEAQLPAIAHIQLSHRACRLA